MARKRQIDPGIWTSEQVVAVSRDARLLFIGLISTADDEGRIKGSPLHLKMTIFPADAVEAETVAGWLDELADVGLVQKYSVDGAEYVALPTWEKYQFMGRRYPSILPAPPGAEELDANSRPTHAQSQELDANDCPHDVQNAEISASIGTGTGIGTGVGAGTEETTTTTTTSSLSSPVGTDTGQAATTTAAPQEAICIPPPVDQYLQVAAVFNASTEAARNGFLRQLQDAPDPEPVRRALKTLNEQLKTGCEPPENLGRYFKTILDPAVANWQREERERIALERQAKAEQERLAQIKQEAAERRRTGKRLFAKYLDKPDTSGFDEAAHREKLRTQADELRREEQSGGDAP